MKASQFIRHSVVRYQGAEYMLENIFNRRGVCSLIPATGGRGKEIDKNTELEPVFSPAMLAMNYLNRDKTEHLFKPES